MFGDYSSKYQRRGTIAGGIVVECGKFEMTVASKTCPIETNLREVFSGFAVSDNTTYMIQGRPVSVCTAAGGAFIDWSMSDATGSTMQFVAFGY